MSELTRIRADNLKKFEENEHVNHYVCFICYCELSNKHVVLRNFKGRIREICEDCNRLYADKVKYKIIEMWQKMTGLCWRCLNAMRPGDVYCQKCGKKAFDRSR